MEFTSSFELLCIRLITYPYTPKLRPPAFQRAVKGQENFRTLVLEAEAAITSHCGGCYSTVLSGLQR